MDQLRLNLLDQRLEAVQEAEVVSRAELFGCGQVQSLPPAAIGGSEGFASRREQVVREQHRPQPVAGLDPLLDQPAPIPVKRPQLTHLHRWHPHAGQHPRREQACQRQRVARIGLDQGLGDQRDLHRVGHRDRGHQRHQQVVHLPGIDGRLQRDHVGSSQVFANPDLEVLEVDAPRREDDLLLAVDSRDGGIASMHV